MFKIQVNNIVPQPFNMLCGIRPQPFKMGFFARSPEIFDDLAEILIMPCFAGKN